MCGILVIVNPASRRGSALSADALRTELPQADIHFTAAPGDALRISRDASRLGFSLIVAAGGDGTINEVVNGIAGTDSALGVLPVGTANVLARELCLPLHDWHKAAHIIRNGKRRKIDVGAANGRRFALMAGVGFDAAVVGSVYGQFKARWGVAGYVRQIVTLMPSFKPRRMNIDADDRRVFEGNAYLAVASNCSRYARHVRLSPAARPDDGALELCVLPAASPAQLKLVVPALFGLANLSSIYPGYVRASGRQFVIRSEPGGALQLDGELAGNTPVEIDTLRAALDVIAP